MDKDKAARIAQRFIELSQDKRRIFWRKMVDEGVTPSQLPILARARSPGEASPASYAQQRLWFLWQLSPESSAYHVSGGLRLRGAVNHAALRASFESIVARHESLRTRFVADVNGRVEQVIDAEVALDWREASLDASEFDATARALAAEPFDLQHGPLLRVALFSASAEEHLLVLSMHHIVSDGWSVQVLLDELVAHYRAGVSGSAIERAALPVQYADYAAWQRDWLDAGERERQLAYWQATLGDEHPVLALPTDAPRPAHATYHAGRHHVSLPPALADAVRERARQSGSTPFMVLLAAFHALLYRYTGQQTVRTGVPVANRHRVEVEGLIGFFVNTQVMQSRVDASTDTAMLLAQVREATLGAQAHQDLPFDALIDALRPERSLSHTPLFQVMFNHQRRDWRVLKDLPSLEIEPYALPAEMAQFELLLDTREESDGTISLELSYARELFEAGTIARMAQHYEAMLKALVEATALIIEVPLLSAEERAEIEGWSRNDTRFKNLEPVIRGFERHAELAPDDIALTFGDIRLSYAELNAKANGLAYELIERGIGLESKVGVAAERSVELVVALLAIMKAGGAYVPLDPSLPHERLAEIQTDSGMTLVLRDIDVSGEDARNPDVAIQGNNLAYVIFTSGSTGRPKGVGNTHAALSNRLQWMQQAYPLERGETVLQKTPFSFDVSVWEFFWPLMVGARLAVAAPGAHRDPLQLAQTIVQQEVSTIHFVPSMLQAFIESEHALSCADTLRRIICSGEALPEELQRKVFARLPNVELHNLYGPTEAAIDVTAWQCREEHRPVPIGAPIAATQTWVLDERMQPVPRGVAGELYLGGANLARGYLNRPGLTSERFVADPFARHAGARLYRTGDLVRWRSDGVLDYLGRLDHQVKIRGFRIELGEIESRLAQIEGVRESTVIARDARLIAYVTGERSLDAQRLKTSLAQGVPDYMVPWRIVVLDAMPLNANGKVDRKALPVPSVQNEDHEWEAPQGTVETQLMQIWSTLLGIERIGRNDNFFELGGDSILGLQIVARLRQSGFIVTARQIFEQQTIAQLAAVAVEAKEGVTEQTGETESSNEPFPLLPIQSWFFEQAMPSRDHWNQSVLLERTTAPKLAHLDTALHALVAHHASLRLRFNRSDDGRWSQHHAPEETHTLMTVMQAVPKRDIEHHCAQAQGSLDIEHGPLIRASAMSIDDGTWRLFIVIHHLAVDAVSWRILLDDLQSACAQLEAGEPIAIPPCTTSFNSFARMQHRAACSVEITAQIPYWNDVLAVSASLPRTHAHAGQPVSATIKLDRDATRKLLQDANAAYRTRIDELLLVAAGRALVRLAHADALRIDIEGHGRDVHGEHADLSRTVGWFTSLYPVVLQAQGKHAAAIKRVKEALRTVPQAGAGFGLLAYSGDDLHRTALNNASNSDVVFNYLGQFGGTLDRDSGWQRASEQTGASQHEDATPAHALEILGQVMNGELSVTFHHRRGDRYDASTIASLSRDFEQELHALNAHCTNGAQGITPSDVPLAELDQSALDALPIEPARIADLYPLAPMQAGIVFHSLLGEHTNAYINQLRVDLDGLDDARFIAAWQAIVTRHAALRTGFIQCKDEPRQWVARSVTLPVFQQDWRHRDARDDALDKLASAQIAQGFDMAEPPLMRIALVRTDEARHHLVWTFHHALLDGWSMAQVLSDVLRYYGGNRQEATLGRYRDFIEWLARNESSRETAHAFWRGLLAPLEGPTHLAASLPRSKDDANETFGDVTLEFDADRTAHLTRFARSQHVTLNTLVQAAWLLLLQRYTHAPTVSFGATVAGRPATLEGVERIVGLFINTVPVVGTPHAAMPVAQWLGEIQQQSVASREHEHVALNEIQRLAQLDGGQSLFDSILVFENYPLDDALRESAHDGVTFSNIAAREQTNYPLTVSITQRTDLRIDFSYARKHFDAASIERIAHHLSTLLDALTIDALRALADVSMLDKDELAHLNRIGERSTATLDATPVHRRIAAHASAHPHDTALVQGNESISFAALEQRANRIVNGLAAIGIGAEARVGIALERSIDMIAALLGVMKSGAAYVPLDPSHPAERLAYMARDSGVKLVIASQEGAFDGVSTLDVATCGEGCVDTDPHVAIHGTQLAYVIYTSGSTGQPKGVEITHDALARHTQAVTDAARITRADRVLQFSTFSFDAFVDQLFPALCMGATVVLRDETLWDSARFLHEVRSQRITVADLTTAYWSALALDFASGPKSAREALASLRRVQVGGEAMFGDSVRAWKAAGLAHVELVNMYGPSETTVTATTFDCTRYVQTQDEIPVRIPIGKPLTGRSVNVLDAQLMPVPMGVPGELYIGGELLARGYRSRPGTTAERFVPDPFSNEAGARMYRAGDIVRWNAEGELDYLGRTDHQVKVRGYRVEPGEIEAQLIRMPNVREAAVIARSSRLIAFVTLNGEASSTDLRARLSEALPDYMVPAALVIVDAMPLNPAGKIDRQRLPDDDHHDSIAQTFVPPEGEIESTLARVWTEVLQVARVGRHDTFFALGGDSLAAMRTQAALRRAQIDAPLAVLISHRPLHEMARALSDESPAGTTSASDAASLLDLMNTL